MKIKQKIILFDEETSPAKGYFFGGLYEVNITKVEEPETIITISYWDSTTNQIKHISQWDFKDWKKNVWNDRSLVKHFREVLINGNYDLIAGQNSDQFDIKLFNARLAYHNLKPLPEYNTLDTKKLAKGKLKLHSYSLDYMAWYFGLKGKYHHSGMDMWFASRDGNKKAQKEINTYCDKDVWLTKEILFRILPFIKLPSSYNRNDGIHLNCSNPNCGSINLKRDKLRKTSTGWRIQYVCKCGKYTTDNNTLYKEKPILKI